MILEQKAWIRIGVIACWLVCIGDFAVNFILGSQIPGYDFLRKTISFLGRTDSPVAHWVKLWGILFFVLFFLFANGWRRAFPTQKKLARYSAWLLVLYGLGEGLGSGLIPYNKINGHLTMSGLLHEIFSGIGDVGMFIFPLFAMQLFTKQELPGIRIYSWVVMALGLLLNVIFLSAKAIPSKDGLYSLLGLWQRLFLLDYYLYFLIVSAKMLYRKDFNFSNAKTKLSKVPILVFCLCLWLF